MALKQNLGEDCNCPQLDLSNSPGIHPLFFTTLNGIGMRSAAVEQYFEASGPAWHPHTSADILCWGDGSAVQGLVLSPCEARGSDLSPN
jgi:hypothetical protein